MSQQRRLFQKLASSRGKYEDECREGDWAALLLKGEVPVIMMLDSVSEGLVVCAIRAWLREGCKEIRVTHSSCSQLPTESAPQLIPPPPMKLPVLLSLRFALADIGLAPPTCGTVSPEDSRLAQGGLGCSRPRRGMSMFAAGAACCCRAEVRFEDWLRGEAVVSLEGDMMSTGGD